MHDNDDTTRGVFLSNCTDKDVNNALNVSWHLGIFQRQPMALLAHVHVAVCVTVHVLNIAYFDLNLPLL